MTAPNWMKVLSNSIRSIQIICDFIFVALSWTLAYQLRFLLIPGAEAGIWPSFVFWFFPLSAFTIYFIFKNGLYDRSRMPTFASEFMVTMRSNAIAIVAFVVLLYFTSDQRISRLTIAIYAIFSTLMLGFGRALVRSSIRKFRRRGLLLNRVLVIGDSPQVAKYLHATEYSVRTGVMIARVLDGRQNLEAANAALDELHPDLVVLGFEDESSPFIKEFIASYYDALFTIQVLPAERQTLLGLTAEAVGDVQVLSLNQPHFSPVELVGKRALDIVASALGLIALLPLFAVLAVAIKASSPGPIFFGQERVGLKGQRFRMWKFRSMRVGVDGAAKSEWTVANDPRRTKIGTFIRSTSIDELPQLWNVFVGQMSLVGPRPEQPYFVEKFRTEIPAYMLRHKMKAGITGWAQVNGWRGDTSLHDRIACDLYYIRNWTFWFDFKIIVLTFLKGFVNKNAY